MMCLPCEACYLSTLTNTWLRSRGVAESEASRLTNTVSRSSQESVATKVALDAYQGQYNGISIIKLISLSREIIGVKNRHSPMKFNNKLQMYIGY